MLKGLIVAIDGPAGAGKSTVSRKLAEVLEGVLLDTGGMYRAVAYTALKEGAADPRQLSAIAKRLKFDLEPQSRALLVDGEDLGGRLRTQEVSELASDVSRHRGVRTALTTQQRKLGKKWSREFPIVVEGRDIGTVVFPDVEFKFFVTASEEVRAKRRLSQLKRQGVRGLSLTEVSRQNERRDRQDSTRKIAPLKCPEDAVIVDTSSMRISQVVRFMNDHIRNRMKLV